MEGGVVHFVDEEDAVEVVDLVLDDAGGKAFHGEPDGAAFDVVGFDFDFK